MTQAETLRGAMHSLFRRFGALSGGSTPCGKPISIAHAHALMVLEGRGELSQLALGAALAIDKSNVARLCAKMTSLGHIAQRTAAHDGRSRLVTLTARGRALAREVDDASKARFDALLAALPVKRRAAVIEALRELCSALEALPSRNEAAA